MIMRLAILAFAAATLAACGRAGDPYTPSEAARRQAKEEGRPAPQTPTPNRENEGKRFVLDGLLE